MISLGLSSLASSSFLSLTSRRGCDICVRDNTQPGCLQCGWIPPHHEILCQFITRCVKGIDNNYDKSLFNQSVTDLVKVIPNFQARSNLLRFTTPKGPLWMVLSNHHHETDDWTDHALFQLFRIGYPWDIFDQGDSIWTYLCKSQYWFRFINIPQLHQFYNEFKIPFDIGQTNMDPSYLSVCTVVCNRPSWSMSRTSMLQFVCENGANPKHLIDDIPQPIQDENEFNKWIKSLCKDNRVWMKDKLINRWCTATVIALEEEKSRFLIHKSGCGRESDEWVTLPNNDHVRPIRSVDRHRKWSDQGRCQIPVQIEKNLEADLRIANESYAKYQQRLQQHVTTIYELTPLLKPICSLILEYCIL